MKRSLQPSSSAVQSDGELCRADPEYAGSLSTIKSVPGDEQKNLLVAQIQRRARFKHWGEAALNFVPRLAVVMQGAT